MKKIFTSLILALLFYTIPCSANIIKTDDVKVIEKIVEKACKNTLIVFDIDDTLIMSTEEFAIREPIRKSLTKNLKEKYNQHQFKTIFSDFFKKRTVTPVDPEIITLVKFIEARKLPMVALTGWWTGQFGTIEKMEELRFKGLNEVMLSFVHTSPFKKSMTFPKLKTKHGTPMLKDGVILTALADKGTVLKAVLDRSRFRVREIIFIDDDLNYLKSVQKMCLKNGIKFQGIHYTAAELTPLPQLNEEKEKMRYHLLEKEHTWLLDKELEERLKSMG